MSVRGALRPLGEALRSLVTIRPDPGRARRAVRWAAAVAAGLVAASLFFGPTVGPLGLIGAMAAGAGREEPLRRRITILLAVGVATIGGQAVGMLAAPHPWLLPPLITALTLAIVWTWHALLVGPPGPISTLFAVAFGAYLGSEGFAVGTVLTVSAFAWAVAAATSVAILALDVHAPERAAVQAADAAVARYQARAGDLPPEEANRLRSEAYVAVTDAWYVLRAGRAPLTEPRSARARGLEDRLRGIHFRLIEILHAESFPTSTLDIRDNFRSVPLGRPSMGYLLRTALGWGSRPSLVAERAALGVLLASSTMIASLVGHPYWAILSALIVLHMGASRADLTIRAAHRVVGTGVGVAAYFVIVLAHPSEWVRVAIVVVAVYLLECFVTRNYSLSVVFITVFALMLTPVQNEAQVATLIRDRFVETITGVAAAVLVIWFVGRRAPVLLVRSHYRRTLGAMSAVLDDLARGDVTSMPSREDRRNLVFELERAGAVLSAQQPDAPVELARWLAVQDRVTRLGFDVVAACWRDLPRGDRAAAAARDQLDALVASLPPVSSIDIDTDPVVGHVEAIHRQYLAALNEGDAEHDRGA